MASVIIVIGLSAASTAFITKLRSFDTVSRVMCFTAEPDIAYNRCLLADVLTHESTPAQIALKPDDFFEKNNIELYLGSRVTKLDVESKLVWVGDQSYRYDELFLGIGTRPLIPLALAVDGLSGVFTFHTLGDMRNIDQYIVDRKPKAAVVIGAGLNGIEAASSLHARGLSVTVVEAQNRILPGQLDVQNAGWVHERMIHQGLTVLAGRKVVRVNHDQKHVTSIQLDSGACITADVVVITAGSQLNSELLLGTGIALHQGSIVVNSYMQTNVAHVLAAGDICSVPDLVSKDMVRSVTWSDAMLQGLCAATTLSAAPRAYPGAIGLRDSYFFGIEFYACGDTASGRYQRHEVIMSQDQVEVWYVHEGKLQGFVVMGDVSKVSELKKLYVTQQSLGDDFL